MSFSATSLNEFSSFGTVASVVVTAIAVLIAWIVGKSSVKTDRQNMTMEVILSCNNRYAEIYSLRNEMESDTSKVKFLRESYFRQYWGLKSDQIDYWIAGFVDPDTLISWVHSTALDLSKKSVANRSYVDDWKEATIEHEHINPTLTNIIREIILINERYSTEQMPSLLYAYLWTLEDEMKKIRSKVRKGNLMFSNLYTVYPSKQVLEIKMYYKRKKKSGSYEDKDSGYKH